VVSRTENRKLKRRKHENDENIEKYDENFENTRKRKIESEIDSRKYVLIYDDYTFGISWS
jgi:hypothetical protein